MSDMKINYERNDVLIKVAYQIQKLENTEGHLISFRNILTKRIDLIDTHEIRFYLGEISFYKIGYNYLEFHFKNGKYFNLYYDTNNLNHIDRINTFDLLIRNTSHNIVNV